MGPDLSWHYAPGNDWLTPILQGCGDVFDIVSIHRYPFSSAQATLAAAMGDATAFGSVIAYVRGLMQAAGAGDKPLALMEMNVAYDETGCTLGASPGTTGSALWLADGLGTAIENGLWTSAVWDISDSDVWSLGLLGLPPAHTPRAEYYAYQLYADHFGSTLLDVPQTPEGIRAYASRNSADSATDLIVVNWNTTSAPLAFEVTGLPAAPASATFTLPALSITAVNIPDSGAAAAWTYGEAQHQAAQGPVTLAPGAIAAVDAGPPQLKNACSSDASAKCSTVVLPSASITTQGTAAGGILTFGSAPYQWKSYTYAGTGQTAPTATVTPDGNGIHIVGAFVSPVTQNWAGVGLFFQGASCIDASAHTGIRFDFSGDLGACTVALGANYSGDDSVQDDSARGSCPFSDSSCYPPMVVVTPPSSATAEDAGVTTFKVPFTSFTGRQPQFGTRSDYDCHGAMATERAERRLRLLGRLHRRKCRVLLSASESGLDGLYGTWLPKTSLHNPAVAYGASCPRRSAAQRVELTTHRRGVAIAQFLAYEAQRAVLGGGTVDAASLEHASDQGFR